jgi:hypothetical protein
MIEIPWLEDSRGYDCDDRGKSPKIRHVIGEQISDGMDLHGRHDVRVADLTTANGGLIDQLQK